MVVVPSERVGLVADASGLREANEEAKRQRLAKGELGPDMYAMRELLKAAGLRYFD